MPATVPLITHPPNDTTIPLRNTDQPATENTMEPIDVLRVLGDGSACGRPSLFSSNVALVLAESCCCGG
jgi:hypothetical protein